MVERFLGFFEIDDASAAILLHVFSQPGAIVFFPKGCPVTIKSINHRSGATIRATKNTAENGYMRTISLVTPLIIFVVTCLTLFGCRHSEQERLPDDAMLIELQGVLSINVNTITGGRKWTAFETIGDVNSDGCTDFVISTTGMADRYGDDRPERPGEASNSGLQAYSGKDGSLLWHVRGKTEEQARTDGESSWYAIKEFAVINDVNGDGSADIYCRHFKTCVLVSGTDGTRICRGEIRSLNLSQPLFSRDVDDDGTADLFFDVSDFGAPGIQAFSGIDLRPVSERLNPWPEPELKDRRWFVLREPLPPLGDVNGDGVTDRLLEQGGRQREAPGHNDFAIVSGADETILKYLQTKRPEKMTAYGPYSTCGADLNSDLLNDIVLTDSTGGGEQGDSGYLMAFSGSDGTLLWQTLNTHFGTSPNPVSFIPDIDGDAISDLAMLPDLSGRHPVEDSDSSSSQILLFSGVDGRPLKPIALPKYFGRISGTGKLLVLESTGPNHQPGLVVPLSKGAPAKKNLSIAIIPLPHRGDNIAD